MQHEVPRPITGPRKDPVDTDLGERDEQPLEVRSRRPYVKIRMFSGLLFQQRVHTPPTTDARIHALGDEPLPEHDHVLGRHRILAHRTRAEGDPAH